MKIESDYIDLESRPGPIPPRLKDPETVRRYPNSEQAEGTCPDCGFRGRYGVYYGWNTYVECPDCGAEHLGPPG